MPTQCTDRRDPPLAGEEEESVAGGEPVVGIIGEELLLLVRVRSLPTDPCRVPSLARADAAECITRQLPRALPTLRSATGMSAVVGAISNK